MALIQFGAIELHPNGARADRPDRPDRLVFDLDPAEGLPFAAVIGAAHELKDRLQQLGLESFPRTTGGKGLHLVVPIERRHDWVEAKSFAGGIARAMQADSPERYTAVVSKAARQGRIFVDYLRNDRTATAVASYSLRGRARAPVAMPLGGDEVTPRLDPLAFTILTAVDLAARRADPWADIHRQLQRLPRSAPAGLPPEQEPEREIAPANPPDACMVWFLWQYAELVCRFLRRLGYGVTARKRPEQQGRDRQGHGGSR